MKSKKLDYRFIQYTYIFESLTIPNFNHAEMSSDYIFIQCIELFGV